MIHTGLKQVFCTGSHSTCDEAWLIIIDLVAEALFSSFHNRVGVKVWPTDIVSREVGSCKILVAE